MYTVRKANLGQFMKCEEHLYGTHKQTKTIFCEADKSLLWSALKVRSTRLTDIVQLKRLLRNSGWVMPLRALRKLGDGTPKRLKGYYDHDDDWNFSLLSASTNLVSNDKVVKKCHSTPAFMELVSTGLVMKSICCKVMSDSLWPHGL